MKVITASFNVPKINAQINITLGQIEELIGFCKRIHGNDSATLPSLAREERPKAIEPLLYFAENLIFERDSILRTIEETCENLTARLETLEENNSNYVIPKLAPVIEKKTK